MEEWLHLATQNVVIIIDAMALIIVAVGTVEAFFTGLWAAFPPSTSHRRFREILAATDVGSSPASLSSSRPTSLGRRLRLAGRRSGSSARSQ